MATDFDTLNGSVNTGTGVVTLTWSLAGLSAVQGKTIISVAIQRSLAGQSAFVTLATSTGVDFAGSTYADTPGAVGEYIYRLIATVGLTVEAKELPPVSVLFSNVVTLVVVGDVRD